MGLERVRRLYQRGFLSLKPQRMPKASPRSAPRSARLGLKATPEQEAVLRRADEDHQGQGLGAGLLKDAIRRSLLIADQAGIRAMLTHPIDEEATRFCLRYGFVASPLRDHQLLLLLKDAKKLLG